MTKSSLWKNSIALFKALLGNKEVYTFPKGFYRKVKVIPQLEIELAYYDVAVQHVR